MQGFLNTLYSYVQAALPILEWLLFFVLLFALIGIGVRFYAFFNTQNYTYYQPNAKNPFSKEPLAKSAKPARISKRTRTGSSLKKKRKR